MDTILVMELKFDAAHRLLDHDGLCVNLHGHTWKVRFTVSGPVGDTGMVVDFKVLKSLFTKTISNFDHSVLLNPSDPLFDMIGKFGLRRIALTSGNPTCENLAYMIFSQVGADLQYYSLTIWNKIKLVSVQVWESDIASAIVVDNNE